MEIAEPDGWATTTIQVFDGLNDLRATYGAGSQPPGGVPIGGARKVRLSTPDAVHRGRVVFHLCL